VPFEKLGYTTSAPELVGPIENLALPPQEKNQVISVGIERVVLFHSSIITFANTIVAPDGKEEVNVTFKEDFIS
jgi:hypothetical protein